MPRILQSRPARGAVAAAAAIALVGVTAAPATAAVPAQLVTALNGLAIESGPDNYSELVLPVVLQTVEDGEIFSYCVERWVGIDLDREYDETDWSGIPNLGNVLWIMEHSVPNVNLADLTEAVEAYAGVPIVPDYDEYEANGGTQLAIWSYTDDLDFSTINVAYRHEYNVGDHGEVDLERLEYLFRYLTDPAVNVGGDEPPASLTLDESGAVSEDGRYGPIVVHTTAASVEIWLEGTAGAVLVDADGQPVSEVSDGDLVFVHLPDATTGSVIVTAATDEAQLHLGRLFRSPGVQAIAAAQTVTAVSSDQVEYAWSELPATGPGSAAAGALAALALLTAGGALLLARRPHPSVRR